MDTTRIDAMARLFAGSMNRRGAFRFLVAGAAALTASTVLTGEDAHARNKKERRKRDRKRDKNRERENNVCEGLNWCMDRSQTCGPEGGYGKCLVKASGENVCAELLFQAASCADCEEPNCTNCRCVPAVGGGDRCNNGANGYEFVCVREV